MVVPEDRRFLVTPTLPVLFSQISMQIESPRQVVTTTSGLDLAICEPASGANREPQCVGSSVRGQDLAAFAQRSFQSPDVAKTKIDLILVSRIQKLRGYKHGPAD